MSTPIRVALSTPMEWSELLRCANLEATEAFGTRGTESLYANPRNTRAAGFSLRESSGTRGLQHCARSDRITALTDDSRCVEDGCCYVAIRGAAHDGHRYIEQAIDAGASVVVVEREVDVPPGVACLRVKDTRSALARLAAAFYGLRRSARGALRLIGVTGTNGKTTVSWMLRSMLQAAGHRPALLGTIEYDLRTDCCPAPLTTPGPIDLARNLAQARDAGADWCVVEVSSHALDQRRTDGLSFSAGVFTNLSGDHLDYHGNMEAYLRSKRRLFDSLDGEAAAVINCDDPAGRTIAADLRTPVVRYGLHSRKADVSARVETSTGRGCRLTLRGRSYEIDVRCRLVGEHNVYNVLAAAAAAEALGLDADSIRDGVEQLDVVPGRLQRIEERALPFSVFVDYAHTDDALRNALKTLRPVTDGQLICVFGCGGDRDRSKRPRMGAVAGELADRAIVTSDNPRTEDPTAIIADVVSGFSASSQCQPEVFVDRREAIEAAISEAKPGDVVLIAGKGHETYQLVGDRVLDFDDAAVAGASLGRRRCRTMTGGGA